MAQDDELITNNDLDDLAYHECVGFTTAVGIGLGAFTGAAPGALIGAVVGHAYGVHACRPLAPEIRKKFFSKTQALNKDEVALIVKKIKVLYPGTTKQQALHALAAIRFEAHKNPWDYSHLA